MNSVTKCYTTKMFLLVYFTNATHVISYSEKTNTVIEWLNSGHFKYTKKTMDKLRYWSVWVLNTTVPIEDTDMNKQILKTEENLFYKCQLAGGWRVSFLQSLLELNLGPPNKNPSSCTKKNLNPGHQDYESSFTLHCKTKWKRNTNREKRSS